MLKLFGDNKYHRASTDAKFIQEEKIKTKQNSKLIKNKLFKFKEQFRVVIWF